MLLSSVIAFALGLYLVAAQSGSSADDGTRDVLILF